MLHHRLHPGYPFVDFDVVFFDLEGIVRVGFEHAQDGCLPFEITYEDLQGSLLRVRLNVCNECKVIPSSALPLSIKDPFEFPAFELSDMLASSSFLECVVTRFTRFLVSVLKRS